VEAQAVNRSAEEAAAPAPAGRAPAPARLDRMVGATDVLALQRAIGNRSLARLAKSERRMLHRACCASCAAGLPCEDELEHEHDHHH
jgi:hypothetical protein